MDELDLREEQPKRARVEKKPEPVVVVPAPEPAKLEAPAPAPLSGLEAVVHRHTVENRVLRLLAQYAEQGLMTHEQRMERLKATAPGLYAEYIRPGQ